MAKTANKLSKTIANKPEIDTIITLDRTHKLGRPKTTGPIPLVAKFHEYKQRELVKTTSITKSAVFRTDRQSVGIQQTKSILQKRRSMFP